MTLTECIWSERVNDALCRRPHNRKDKQNFCAATFAAHCHIKGTSMEARLQSQTGMTVISLQACSGYSCQQEPTASFSKSCTNGPRKSLEMKSFWKSYMRSQNKVAAVHAWHFTSCDFPCKIKWFWQRDYTHCSGTMTDETGTRRHSSLSTKNEKAL